MGALRMMNLYRFLSFTVLQLIASVLHAEGVPPVSQELDPCFRDKVCFAQYKRARDFSDKRRYQPALDAYKEAYQRVQVPWLLVNIGRMQQFLGNPVEAIRNYDLFMSLPGSEQYPEFLQSARTHKAEAISASQSTQPIAVRPSAVATLSSESEIGKTTAPTPPKERQNEAPRATAGAATSPTSTSGSASKLQSAARLEPEYRSSRAPDLPSQPLYKKWWLWTVVGVVATAGVTGAVVGGLISRGGGTGQPDPMVTDPTDRMLPMPWFHPFAW